MGSPAALLTMARRSTYYGPPRLHAIRVVTAEAAQIAKVAEAASSETTEIFWIVELHLRGVGSGSVARESWLGVWLRGDYTQLYSLQ